MNDFEARLRDSLRRNLDAIDAAPYLPSKVAVGARRRRFATGTSVGTAAVVFVTSMVWLASTTWSDRSPPPVAPDTSGSPSPTPPDCKPVGEGGYRIHLSESSAPRGATIEVTGSTPIYAKDGSYRPPDGEVQLWWNADPDGWHSVLPGGDEPVPDKPGEVLKVGAARLAGTCTFRTSFTVPDSPPGEYRIVPVNIDYEDGRWSSATFFGAHAPEFEVLERWFETDGGYTTLHDDDDLFTVTYPESWLVSDERINTWVSSPFEILALATYPLSPGGEAVIDAQVPSNAIDDLGPDDIFIWMNDGGDDGSSFPDRPAQFEPLALCGEDFDQFCSDPEGETLGIPGIRAWWLRFADAGRGIYLFVGMGEQAFQNPARAQQAWDVLNSLRFEPR